MHGVFKYIYDAQNIVQNSISMASFGLGVLVTGNLITCKLFTLFERGMNNVLLSMALIGTGLQLLSVILFAILKDEEKDSDQGFGGFNISSISLLLTFIACPLH